MLKRIGPLLFVLVISVAVFALSGKTAEPVATSSPVTSFDLLAALPASDFIVYVDSQRALTDVIPAVLVERPEARAKIEADIEKFKKQVGFDPRLLDAVAVGVNFSAKTSPGTDFTVLARGRFDANAVIDTGLTAASKESGGELVKRTQVYEGRTLYLLVNAARLSVDRNAAKEEDYKPGDQVMVFVALDSNTVAFGNMKSVRATIDASLGQGRVDDELVQLASRTPNAVACFSGKLPPDMVRHMRFGNKEVESTIGGVKVVYGAFSQNGTDGEALVNMRMEAEEDARKVTMTLNALKFITKIGAGEASARRKSIDSLIKNVEVYAVGNEVQITAKVALADLSPIVPFR